MTQFPLPIGTVVTVQASAVDGSLNPGSLAPGAVVTWSIASQPAQMSFNPNGPMQAQFVATNNCPPGTYTVTASAPNSAGGTATGQFQLVVPLPPAVTFTFAQV